jgi:hypothetical protein
VHFTDLCCDEFVDDCGTTKPLSEQHVSITAGKIESPLRFLGRAIYFEAIGSPPQAKTI